MEKQVPKKRLYLSKNFIEYLKKVTKLRDEFRKEMEGITKIPEFHEYESGRDYEKIIYKAGITDEKILVYYVEIGEKKRIEKEYFKDYYTNGVGKFEYNDSRDVTYFDPYYKKKYDEYPLYLLDAYNLEQDCEEPTKWEELVKKIKQEVSALVEEDIYNYYSHVIESLGYHNDLMYSYGKDNFVTNDTSDNKMKKDKLNQNFNLTLSERIASFVLSGTTAANDGVINLKMYDRYILKDNYILRKGTPENLTYEDAIDYTKKDLINYMYSIMESNGFIKYLYQLSNDDLLDYIYDYHYMIKGKYKYPDFKKYLYDKYYIKESETKDPYWDSIYSNAQKWVSSLNKVLEEIEKMPTVDKYSNPYPIPITFNLEKLKELINLYLLFMQLINEPLFDNDHRESRKNSEKVSDFKQNIEEYFVEHEKVKERIRSLKEATNK